MQKFLILGKDSEIPPPYKFKTKMCPNSPYFSP